MRKIFILFIIFIIITFFYLDSNEEKEEREINNEELRGLFISYIELDNYIKDKDITTAKNNIKKIIKNTKENNFNTLILQVRSHDDAIYKSNNFRNSSSIILNDGTYFDVLSYFLKVSKKYNIDVYIWINPYRASRLGEEIDGNSFANKYINTDTIKKIDGIYYYNPSKKEVEDHIVEGIKELVKNYKFKGILFDDYFYPSLDIDKNEYEEYITKKSITVEDYHLNVINNLIKRVYKEIKSINKDVLFGISPDGNIENNYNKNFADVKLWTSKEGYIDFIMPQIYYGFYNSVKPYKKTIDTWNNMITNDNIKLYYALAFYKVGKKDLYAKEGVDEWILNSDIIKKQIILARNTSHYSGFCLFRYDNLFNKELYTMNTLKELDNLKSTLKK